MLSNLKLFPCKLKSSGLLISHISPAVTAPGANAPIQGQPLPPDYGPPPYEATHPGFLPPHVPGDGPMPMHPLQPGAADANKHAHSLFSDWATLAFIWSRAFGHLKCTKFNIHPMDLCLNPYAMEYVTCRLPLCRWPLPASARSVSSPDARTDGPLSRSVCPHGGSHGDRPVSPWSRHHCDRPAGGNVPDLAGADGVSALSAGDRNPHLPRCRPHELALLPLLLLRGVSGTKRPGCWAVFSGQNLPSWQSQPKYMNLNWWTFKINVLKATEGLMGARHASRVSVALYLPTPCALPYLQVRSGLLLDSLSDRWPEGCDTQLPVL